MQKTRGARANGPGVDGVQLAVGRGDGVTVVALGGVVQFTLKSAIFAVAVNHILHRGLRERGRFLIYPGELPGAGKGKTPAVGAYLVFQKRQERGFATAVFADQAHFLARIDRGGGVVQQHAGAATNL